MLVAVLAGLLIAASASFAQAPNADADWPASTGGTLGFAHRGASAAAPENTLAAFDRAVASGADVIELDVRLTADERVVVIHDATVDRTTDGSGEVSDMTLIEIEHLDAGYDFEQAGRYPYRGAGLRVPTLEEVLRRYPESRLNIEVKDDSVAAAGQVVKVIRGSDAERRVLVASRHHSVVSEIRNEGTDLATGASGREAVAFIALSRLGMAGLLDPAYERLQIPPARNGLSLVSPSLISDAENAGVPVDVWTVNDPQEIRSLIALGVDGIVTDHPERIPPEDSPSSTP